MWLKGTLDYNLSLSNRRAKAVVSRLSSQSGISVDRLVPPGLGQLAPLASNDTEEDRATAWGCDFKRTELSRRS
jgi:OOP family OmpA-OmpF porin